MMGRRQSAVQQDLWIATDQLALPKGHPFYQALNRLLEETGFDPFVQELCAPFYCLETGRPGVPPEVYFRMLMVGYFEGLDSERGIAWRSADSLALRAFLGYTLDKSTPDHSSLCRIRQRLPLELHREIFVWVLTVLATKGLLEGKTVGVDATTLEANAAMRSIVRRDTGASYDEFLEQLARASGVDTPTRDDLARLDRKRKKTTSNKDWAHPHDADARIAKMKDGRTHLAHKAEHAVDMHSGVILATTLQGADLGDTTTLTVTLAEAIENLDEVRAAADESSDDDSRDEPDADDSRDDSNDGDTGGSSASTMNSGGVEEVVADKGYHSNDTCRDLKEAELRSYISEPDRGRRKWDGKPDEQAAVYANRRRVKGDRGKALMADRGELIERGFAHCFETGAMRRTHLRGHPNILKRLLIHVAGFNLGQLLRRVLGVGTPRGLQNGLGALARAFLALFDLIEEHLAAKVRQNSSLSAFVMARSIFSPNRMAA